MLLIPDNSYVGKKAALEIEKFVCAGGRLIVTGALPISVDEFEKDSHPALTDDQLFKKLCGIKLHGILNEPISYLQLKNTLASEYWNLDFIPEIGVYGKATLVVENTAIKESPLYYPAPVYQIGARPLGEKSNYCGITKDMYEKGVVTYISLPIATDYMKFGNFMEKRLLCGIIDKNLEPYAKLTGCSNAQLIVAKDDTTICVGVSNCY
ncbi:hypothetical protein AN641_07125 [Candidatus Epulonipiscioides gigas]|nr:hypothetical protein AN641_07125 [Epulopiscium sp. SCG-C07WGA-EpuloA2]